MKPIIDIRGLSYNRSGKTIFEKLTLQFEENKMHALLGSNGSGKSTLLRLAKGRERPTAGAIKVLCQHNDIAYLPQDYRACLMPWRSIKDNILLPLQIRKCGKKDQLSSLEHLLSKFQNHPLLSQNTAHSSGGELQLTAILQRLITQPKLLLLDEPSSALDLERRVDLWNFLEEYQQDQSASIIFVSHCFDEVLRLAERITLVKNVREVHQIILADQEEYRLSNFVNLFTRQPACA